MKRKIVALLLAGTLAAQGLLYASAEEIVNSPVLEDTAAGEGISEEDVLVQQNDMLAETSAEEIPDEPEAFEEMLDGTDTVVEISEGAETGEKEQIAIESIEEMIVEEEADPALSQLASGDVGINAVNFPDEAFRSHVSDQLDIDKDGMLSAEEIKEATYLDFSEDTYVKSAAGIEFLYNLENLSCGRCTELSSLDISKNTQLTYVDCSECNLSSLDVSKNVNLYLLQCETNHLSSLDVSKNADLEYLYCQENNLTSLDVSQNESLYLLYCDNNSLTSLDVSKNVRLDTLYCDNNNLSVLKLYNGRKMSMLLCGDNHLGSLTLSDDASLWPDILYCSPQTCNAPAIKTGSGWEINITDLVGAANVGKVTVDTQKYGAAYANGVIKLSGSTLPESLVYTYNINAESVMEVSVKPVVSQAHTHTWGGWQTVSAATIFEPETQQRICSGCKETEKRAYGSKLTPTILLNASSLKLKKSQSTSAFKVSGMAAGDTVSSVTSNKKNVVKVVSYTPNGAIKLKAGKKTGTAKLTITLKSGLKKTVTVKVQKGAVKTTKIKVDSKNITLSKGSKTTLKPIITPITSKQKVTYTSSNKKVVTVSSKGVIKAKKAGTAKITVKSGSKKVTVKVKVTK